MIISNSGFVKNILLYVNRFLRFVSFQRTLVHENVLKSIYMSYFYNALILKTYNPIEIHKNMYYLITLGVQIHHRCFFKAVTKYLVFLI